MGLFSKKEACPVCGNEVKGLFLKKIADKQTLCKDCSKAISLEEELQKNAAPEYIKEHLEKRRANAALFAATAWDAEYTAIGLKVGVNKAQQLLYISYDKMNNEDNPTIFSFDSLIGYELFKSKKKLDDADDPGETALETNLGAVAALSQLVSGKDSNNVNEYVLKLSTTNQYWPRIELKLTCTDNQMFGHYGDHKKMAAICQIFKRVVRKEPVSLPML